VNVQTVTIKTKYISEGGCL